VRKTLTDRYLKSLEKATPGERPITWDTVVPPMGIRITDRGHKTLVLGARFPGKHFTVRELGEYGPLTLEQARTRARHWLELIGKGIDPAIDKERQRQAEVQRQGNTFGAVAEAFIAEKLPSERKGEEVARDIRNEFLTLWETRPITDITDLDVLAAVKSKKKSAPAQARNLLGHLKRLFTWAIDQRVYGLKTSPCDGLKPAKIIGKKRPRNRVLGEDELFALWRAVKRMPYPVGPVYRLLTFAALRLNEVADASWPEFDPAVVRALRQRRDDQPIDWTKLKAGQLAWTIPAERMKGKNEDARSHMVPLTSDVLQILESLPLFKKGDHLFSTTFGEKPVWIGDKIKKQLDARMLLTLRAMARQRGDDPAKVKLAHWVNHDIRRTVRSNLSRLKVTEEAREAVIAHAPPGIKGVYDVYDYFDEKREALELWAARLRSIVEPPPAPANVVKLQSARVL
jgi:Arm domain-containing DNA-binding protein/integrase-like protein